MFRLQDKTRCRSRGGNRVLCFRHGVRSVASVLSIPR